VLSSHVVAELERVASYLIVLSSGQVMVSGTVDELVAAHGTSVEQIVLASLRDSAGREPGKDVAA
jgi:ABC-type multidrug transport system ATPase subunit